MDQKRRRAKNFTGEEEIALVTLVEKFRNILENKKSDAATWKAKEEAWQRVAAEFTKNTGQIRTPGALRAKYESLKSKSKKEMTEEKLQTGDDSHSSVVSALSKRIIGVIGMPAPVLACDAIDMGMDAQSQDAVTDDLEEDGEEEEETESATRFPSDSLNSSTHRKRAKRSHSVVEAERRTKEQFLLNEDRRAEERHRNDLKRHSREMERLSKEIELLDNKINNEKTEPKTKMARSSLVDAESRAKEQFLLNEDRRAEERHRNDVERHFKEMERLSKENELLDLKIRNVKNEPET